MPDQRFDLGMTSIALDTDARLRVGAVEQSAEPLFLENRTVFTVDDYVVINGVPVADGAGARIRSVANFDSSSVVTAPLNPLTLFPEAYAHWVPGLEHTSLDDTFFRWWPVGGTRTAGHVRMSLFRQERASDPGGIVTGAKAYGDGVGAPAFDAAYTYQGFGRSMTRKALTFNSRGYCKIDPEANFTSCTFAVTAVFHPSRLSHYGIFEAAQAYDATSSTAIGTPLVLRYHHGQLRLYSDGQLVLRHESHKASAGPMAVLFSLDTVTKVGRLYCLDENRTTRTFNTEGLDVIALLGIFGGLGQGTTAAPYNIHTADMDVLDVCIWNYSMDWPELEAKANLLSLAYGVGI